MLPPVHQIVYFWRAVQAPLIVGGARDNRHMSVALAEPVDVMAGCLDSVREMLPSLDDKEITQALRDIGCCLGGFMR